VEEAVLVVVLVVLLKEILAFFMPLAELAEGRDLQEVMVDNILVILELVEEEVESFQGLVELDLPTVVVLLIIIHMVEVEEQAAVVVAIMDLVQVPVDTIMLQVEVVEVLAEMLEIAQLQMKIQVEAVEADGAPVVVVLP
jgi:hypothetical protein